MPVTKLRAIWPVLAIVLCVAMLATLAVLQFGWTRQLSLAQASMMQNALSNSIRQFEQVLQREVMSLHSSFQPRVRVGLNGRWSQYAEDYALWAQSTAYPDMLSSVLFYSFESDGSGVLRELVPGGTEPLEAEWDESLAAIRDPLDAASAAPGRTGGLRPFVWSVFPKVRAVTRAEVLSGILRRGVGRPPRRGPSEYVILVLDWEYVKGTVLPDITRRLFAGPEGEQLYQVAILAGGASRFLYRSDPSIGSGWLAGVDDRRRLRLFRDAPRGLAPGTEDGGGPGNEPIRGLAGPGGSGRRLSPLVRPRLLMASGRPPPSVVVAAKHASGSLESVVERQRARNLATGLGVLVVLAGAMALLMVSARRAEQLARMQMEFIAGVTHELRTPLAVIRSVGENLADGVVRTELQIRRYGELVRDQGKRLSQMVEKTLQAAALETGSAQLQLVSLDARKAVAQALETAHPMIEQAGFAVERHEGTELPAVRADEGALQQILANLLSNAVKYGEPGRWVRIETDVDGQREPPCIRIRVRDRGPGIPASEANRVFNAYYRGSAAGAGNIQGSGLGLKLARDLAEGMGGSLSFRSEAGGGTVFVLRLPVGEES